MIYGNNIVCYILNIIIKLQYTVDNSTNLVQELLYWVDAP